jgi:hypothetical protein
MEHDIVWLEIAMHDFVFVEVLEPLTDLPYNSEYFDIVELIAK